MDQTLVLHIPQELYEALRIQAEKKGQTLDTLAVKWLTETMQHADADEIDPLVELFGTIESDNTDIAEHHDDYLGAALAHTLRRHE